MGKFDDMLYELALSANKPRYWANELRREARRLSQDAVAYQSVGAGIKVPFIEAEGGRFDKLPHEAAMLYAPDVTELADVTWYDVTWFDDPYTLDPDTTASHVWGLRVDAATGYIYVDNVPKESLLMIHAWAHFVGCGHDPATGNRQIKWIADDTSEKWNSKLPDDTTGVYDTYVEVTHFRPVPSSHTWYKLAVGQTSGHALNVHSIGFVVVRLT